jgi:ribosomal protein L7/L12
MLNDTPSVILRRKIVDKVTAEEDREIERQYIAALEAAVNAVSPFSPGTFTPETVARVLVQFHPNRKIANIAVIRSLFALSLLDSKNVVDAFSNEGSF